MNVAEQLKSRDYLTKALADLEFDEDIPAILALHETQALFQKDNIAVLAHCYEKWQSGERLMPADLAGAAIDRMLFLKVLCVLLAGLIRRRHAELGLPADLTDETCRGIGGGLFKAMTEYPDALVGKLGWTNRYSLEIMFKTGVFVYRLGATTEKLPAWAFRENATGKVVALASDGIDVHENGLICLDGQEPVFTTSLRQTATHISGNYITPSGRISERCVTLSLNSWENVLAPGALTAEMHIPPGRSMVVADCGVSMKRAAQVFQGNLKQHNVRCFTCMSWVFSPEWLELLPESNMAQFMREVYLFPIKSIPTAGINFVFRKSPEELDLKTAPRKSRLQRIMLERLEKKKPLYAGGMLMLLDDVDKFGTQCYCPVTT